MSTLYTTNNVLAHSSSVLQSSIDLVLSFETFDELRIAVNDGVVSPPANHQPKIREAILLIEQYGEQLESMMRPLEGGSGEEENSDETLMYEMPVPCPVGTYCREGVSTPITIVGDYSTPQPCYDGFFW